MPKDFRHLQEKVEFGTLTGDEPHQHVFRQKTPADIVGAVNEVEASHFIVTFSHILVTV